MCMGAGCMRGMCVVCWPRYFADDWRCPEHALPLGVAGAPDPALASPAPPPVGAPVPRLVEFFADALRRMDVVSARAAVEAALAADPRPPRRWLPGSQRRACSLVPAAAVVAFDLALGGCAAAEIVALFFPRLFLRRGIAPLAAVRAFCGLGAPPVASAAADSADLSLSWARRVGCCARDASVREVLGLLDAGPTRLLAPAAALLDDLFPDLGGPAPLPGGLGPARAAPRPLFAGRALRRWAAAHREKSGGRVGWSGRLVLGLDAALPRPLSEAMAALWSRPPERWASSWACAVAYRAADGWLLPKPDGGARPIAAPVLPRRLASAADARRVHAAAAGWCAERGQVGLRADAALLARSFAASLTVRGGGTVLAADRARSFQTLLPAAVARSVAAFAADAARSDEADVAAAVVRLYGVCVDPSGVLPRTVVDFGRGSAPRAVCGLAQGCSSSPLFQALTLAGQLERAPAAAGIWRSAAHDDVLIGSAGAGALADFAPPSCAEVGGAYNLGKARACGLRAAELVAARLATVADPVLAAWGRPVGSAAAWLEAVFVPQVRGRLAALRRVAAVSMDDAIWAWVRLSGPGALAQHWLRALVPADIGLVRPALQALDDAWVALGVELAGGAGVPPAAAAAVFGAGPAALGHLAAADLALCAPLVGRAVAWPLLDAPAAALGVSLAGWAGALGAVAPVGGFSVAAVADAFRAEADVARAAWEARRALLGLGAPLAVPSTVDGREVQVGSMWVWALQAGGALRLSDEVLAPLRVAAGRAFGPGIVRVALARVLGVPVWSLLRPVGAPPTVCPRCPARILSLAVGAAGAALGPTQVLDEGLVHAGVCRAAPLGGNTVWRHDQLVRALAAVSDAVGRGGRYHDRVFWSGCADRPADLFEPPTGARPGGHAVDVTVVTGGLARLAAASRAKKEGYAGVLSLSPGMAFSVFPVGADGLVGREADAYLRELAVSLASSRLGSGLESGQPLEEVRGEVGRAFAAVVLAQIARWWLAPVLPAWARRVGVRRCARSVARVPG